NTPPPCRNFACAATSNRVPRTLVVWGTSVTSTRSCGSVGTLSTRHGLTFPTRPRSTTQTEPRSARGMAGLFRVQGAEQLCSRLQQGRLGHIALRSLGEPAQNLDGRLVLVGLRQGIEGV